MINEKRLRSLFETFIGIDSVSKKEGRIASTLAEMLRSLGADVVVDGAGQHVGADTGNLIARFSGRKDHVSPLLLCAHMDTVEPGQGVRPHFSDGLFFSAGDTILGADDKSALAVIMEVLTGLVEKSFAHGPLEVVFTICEEVGLLGAKHLDYSLISARYGFCLDAREVYKIVTRAPALNRLQFTVYGRGAHAGAEPEKGINAIQIAGEAISKLYLGRIDEETTANIGVIQGGRANNIVPDEVLVTGEVRSHNLEKLDRETAKIVQSFESAVASAGQSCPVQDGRPKLAWSAQRDFSPMQIPDDHAVVQLAAKAAQRLGREMKTKTSGGGSDGNIFFEHGIVTGILGTGMKDVHTVRESIALEDMVQAAELLVEIIRVHGHNGE